MSIYRYSLIEYLLFPPTMLNGNIIRQRLEGKTVLITGASYGIGEALAYMLAPTGAKLLLVARTEEKLVAVQRAITQMGGIAVYFAKDLTRQDQIEELIGEIQEITSGIDIVVNNAGKSICRPLYESLERYHDFTRSMAINYFGPVQLLLSLLPMVERKQGHIINVSAINVLLAPAPHWAAYQSSKTAFDQWFRCAAPELHVRGIVTTSIYFPLVRTRMIAPTALYQKMPAMSAEHAARKICKAICTQQRKVAPWWLVWGQLASVIFRRQWEWLAARYLKK
jgi:short-subunit dehydrogenase